MELFVNVFANFAFVLTIIAIIFLNGTAYIFWKHRELTLIRFRWPLSYLIWCMLSNLYFLSRIIYLFGEIYGYYSYGEGSTIWIAMHCIRVIGLNGSYMILLCRIWLFYYTYAYDQQMLLFHNKSNSKIMRYHNKLGNERFMLLTVCIIFLFLSIFVILEETILNKLINGFTQIYFGISFLLFVILAFFIPRKHDQLGLWSETICYFVLSAVAIIVLFIIQFTTKNTAKRVISYLGGTIVFLLINTISFYITIIRYEGYKYILNRYNNENDLSEINQNYVELAKIITHSRTYNTFRKFLADIFCVENLDFITIIQYYREFALNGCINIDNIDNGNNSPIIKSISHHSRDSMHKLNKQKSRKTQEQIIANLVIKDNESGQKIIDITRLELNFVKIPNELIQLNDIKLWNEWIFNHYITNESVHCLNLSSKIRKNYIKKYTELMDKVLSHHNNNNNDNNKNKEMLEITLEEKKDNNNNKNNESVIEISSFYDRAQIEIWKLMAQDSMVHFRNSQIYSQMMWKKEENQ